MNNWIKCSDRLPENSPHTILICSYSHQRKLKNIMSSYYNNDRFYDYIADEEIPMDDGYWEITHWLFTEAPND